MSTIKSTSALQPEISNPSHFQHHNGATSIRSWFLTRGKKPAWWNWLTGREELRDQSWRKSRSRPLPSAAAANHSLSNSFDSGAKHKSGCKDYIHDLPFKLQFFHWSLLLYFKTVMTTLGILTSGLESVTVKGQDRLGTFIVIIKVIMIIMMMTIMTIMMMMMTIMTIIMMMMRRMMRQKAPIERPTIVLHPPPPE